MSQIFFQALFFFSDTSPRLHSLFANTWDPHGFFYFSQLFTLNNCINMGELPNIGGWKVGCVYVSHLFIHALFIKYLLSAS